ncbi:N-acetyltransferase [Persicobacter diffluens]|uniref:GNAT family acetyltransferase n=1 Tax=Persicobacter diffluens TaxID=981 RepID=A0AAN4VYD0_9BACT|nr:GNAT family acetyltransferase [Persicobacter diffluens]
MEDFIQLTSENIDQEHICCAFSDKKCQESYALKKEWLKQEFENGFTFLRLDERAKVFLEYVPAENAWIPVIAPDYLMLNCFWVSGKYKGNGYGKALIQKALEEADQSGKNGLVAVVGTKKFHFMTDGKWLQRQGFVEVERLDSGFSLLVKKIKTDAPDPVFNENCRSGECEENEGLVAYYSHRCPFAEYHVQHSLQATAESKGIPLKLIRLESKMQAQNCPSPATIFSLFYQGKFLTTDLSVCMEARFDKFMSKLQLL